MCCEAARDGDKFGFWGERGAGRGAGGHPRTSTPAPAPPQPAWPWHSAGGESGPSAAWRQPLAVCRGQGAPRPGGDVCGGRGTQGTLRCPAAPALRSAGAQGMRFNPRNSLTFLDIHLDVVCRLNITYDRCSSHCFQLNLAC